MIADFSDVPVLATLPEASKFLRLSPRKVWDMGKKRQIAIERIGRAVRYRLREFVSHQQVING